MEGFQAYMIILEKIESLKRKETVDARCNNILTLFTIPKYRKYRLR